VQRKRPHQCNASVHTSATQASTPVQRKRPHQCNASIHTSAMQAVTPVQCKNLMHTTASSRASLGVETSFLALYPFCCDCDYDCDRYFATQHLPRKTKRVSANQGERKSDDVHALPHQAISTLVYTYRPYAQPNAISTSIKRSHELQRQTCGHTLMHMHVHTCKHTRMYVHKTMMDHTCRYTICMHTNGLPQGT
jgi:hypothetical protein